ncbi:unnamed protein product [Lepidochelys kempii]
MAGPLARGEGQAGQRCLSRLHTLATLPAHPEPQDSLGPAPAPPNHTSPPGPPAAPGPRQKAAPLRFPSLSHKKGPPKGAEEQAGPISPRASPKGVSTLVGFFWRLSLAEKLLGSSQS